MHEKITKEWKSKERYSHSRQAVGRGKLLGGRLRTDTTQGNSVDRVLEWASENASARNLSHKFFRLHRAGLHNPGGKKLYTFEQNVNFQRAQEASCIIHGLTWRKYAGLKKGDQTKQAHQYWYNFYEELLHFYTRCTSSMWWASLDNTLRETGRYILHCKLMMKTVSMSKF